MILSIYERRGKMDKKELVLQTMKKLGKPVRPGDLAKELGMDLSLIHI